MILSARGTTRLPGYGRLVAILAETRDFQLAAILSGACAISFPPFLWCEAYALWLLWRFRLCCSRRGFRCCTGWSACCVWFGRFLVLAFRFWLVVIGRIWVDWEIEFPFEGSAYRPLVRGVAHIKVEAVGKPSNDLGEPHPVDLGVRRCSLVSLWAVCRIWQY